MKTATELVLNLGSRHGKQFVPFRVLVPDGTRLVKIRDWDPVAKRLQDEPDYVTSCSGSVDGKVLLHFVGDDEPTLLTAAGEPELDPEILGLLGFKRCSPNPQERAAIERMNDGALAAPVVIGQGEPEK